MKKLVIANWKMNGSLTKVEEDIKSYLSNSITNQENVILSLPSVYLSFATKQLDSESKLKIAAQDVSEFANFGAYTGEVNAVMLSDIGAKYVLVGHSERRNILKEQSAKLIAKLNNAFAENVTPIYCVGELLEIRQSGNYLSYIEKQLDDLLAVVGLKSMIIAYEPCWSIGTGLIPTMQQIDEVAKFIHTYVQKKLECVKIMVIYGGSVTPVNAGDILALASIDGLLVGGASLKVADFTALCELS